MKLRLTTVLILAQLCGAAFIHAQPANKEHWVATWTTAQLLARDQPAPQTAATTPRPQAAGARGYNNQTVRMVVRASIGGRRLRVKLASAFASAPVAVGAAHIAIRVKESEIAPGTDRALTFNGKPSCTIGPGMVILSDPVDLNAPPLADLAVSLYFPGETGPLTSHATGLHTTYVADGDLTGQTAITGGSTTQSYYWLAGVDVLAPANASLIVAFGDSITDGARSTPETNHAWPSLLAARLAAKKDTAHFAVANMGIGGNRLLRDGTGASALARFDRDVLSQSGVSWVVVLEGINDIGREATVPAEAVTADELIGAYKQIIERAHTHGIKVVGATLTPYEGASYSRETGEAVREALNQWIRSSGACDAVVDFEAATRDPANPKHIRADFDPGDHLHPNDAGYQAMADAFDLGIFTGKGKAGKR
ncbi:MAG: SGNH/GDSL hydrolase family protein [Bryobacteraceae bacterium]